MSTLFEDSRQQLITKSKTSTKGKQRFDRRNKSRVSSVVKSFNSIDMNKLFKEDILTVNIPVKGETDDYLVRITFGGFLEILRDSVVEKQSIDFRDISRAAIIGFNRDDVFIHCSCLHPSTPIKLLDGSTPTVEELLHRFEAGEKLYVYSTDSKGDFEPGEVEKVWVTGSSDRFIRITLDNDESILTTPEHLYMLRDGSYRMASELSIKDSLMPMYFMQKNGYELYKPNTLARGWKSTYKKVASVYHADKIKECELLDDGSMPYKVAIHHKNFIKSNNNPENLEPMTARDHWSYHNSLTFNNRPKEVQESIRRAASEGAIIRNASPTEAMIRGRKKWQERGRLRNFDEDRKAQQAEIMRNAITKYYQELTEEQREALSKHRSEASSAYWERGCFNTEKFKNARIREGKRLFSNPEHQKKMLYRRPLYTLQKLVDEGIPLTEENYEAHRRKTDPRITTLFRDMGEAISYYNLNHRVKNIEIVELDHPIEVYDIKVKGWHNFVVGQGVVLHNCPDFRYRFNYYATRNQINSGAPETRPSKITNPNDTLGSGCKHILLVLNNTSWIIRVARVIINYIRYMEKHYPKMYYDIMYPAIYGKKYEEPVQLSLDDTDELMTDTDTVDAANDYNKERTKFQKGNEQGIRFAKNPNKVDSDQVELGNEDDEL